MCVSKENSPSTTVFQNHTDLSKSAFMSAVAEKLNKIKVKFASTLFVHSLGIIFQHSIP